MTLHFTLLFCNSFKNHTFLPTLMHICCLQKKLQQLYIFLLVAEHVSACNRTRFTFNSLLCLQENTLYSFKIPCYACNRTWLSEHPSSPPVGHLNTLQNEPETLGCLKSIVFRVSLELSGTTQKFSKGSVTNEREKGEGSLF